MQHVQNALQVSLLYFRAASTFSSLVCHYSGSKFRWKCHIQRHHFPPVRLLGSDADARRAKQKRLHADAVARLMTDLINVSANDPLLMDAAVKRSGSRLQGGLRLPVRALSLE